MNNLSNTLNEIYCGFELRENIKDFQVFTAYIPNYKKHLSFYSTILSPGELQKASSFKFLEHRENYIVSRGILRCLLCDSLRQDPKDVCILYGQWGKPCLPNDLSLFFNVSHSKDYAAYAFSSKDEVGIDIEIINPILDVDNLVSQILSSPEELDFWHSVNASDRVETFYKLWVCKEAYLKASGQGWLKKNTSLPSKLLSALTEPKEFPLFFKTSPECIGAVYIESKD